MGNVNDFLNFNALETDKWDACVSKAFKACVRIDMGTDDSFRFVVVGPWPLEMGVIMDRNPVFSSDNTPLIPLDDDARDPALRLRGVFI